MKSFSDIILVTVLFLFYYSVIVVDGHSSTVNTNNYVASSTVSAGHQIPPQQQFSLSYSYVTGLLLFPAIIIGLGLLSVFIFLGIMCVRGCYHIFCPTACSGCYNMESASTSDLTQRKTMHWRSIYWLFTFVALAFVTNFFVFLANSYLDTGGKQASNSIVQSANLFSSINSNAKSISFDLRNISQSFSTQPCQSYWMQQGVYQYFVDECDTGVSAILGVTSVVGSVPGSLNDANDALNNKGLYYKNIAVYVLFAVITVSIALLVLAYFVQAKWLLTVAIILSLLMVLLTTLVGSTIMLLVHGGADFCMAPADNIVRIASNDIAQYYTTCAGTNPFADGFNTTLTELHLLSNSFGLLYPSAYKALGDEPCLTGVQHQIDKTYVSLYQIGDDIDCAFVYGIYDEAVNQAVCTSAYDGLFGVFIVQLLTAGFLFFSLFGAIHFYEMWYPTQNSGNIELSDSIPGSIQLAPKTI